MEICGERNNIYREDKKIKKKLFILYFYYFKKLINNVMILSLETKTMYQTNFFL